MAKGEGGEIWSRQIAAGGYAIRKDWEVLQLIFKICSLIHGQLQVFCVLSFLDRENRKVFLLQPNPSPGHYGSRVEDLGFVRGFLYSEEC